MYLGSVTVNEMVLFLVTTIFRHVILVLIGWHLTCGKHQINVARLLVLKHREIYHLAVILELWLPVLKDLLKL